MFINGFWYNAYSCLLNLSSKSAYANNDQNNVTQKEDLRKPVLNCPDGAFWKDKMTFPKILSHNKKVNQPNVMQYFSCVAQ